MNHLPDKVIALDQIRINKGLEKICKCEQRRFVIDEQNRRVNCNTCGAIVDPYDAMHELATNGGKLQRQVESLLEQRKQILSYKPWLVTIKNLEKQYRGKKRLPNCPRCEEPFYLEEIKSWCGKEYGDMRIKRWKENKNE